MQKVTSVLAQNIDSVYDVPRILLNTVFPAFLTNLLLQIGNQCRCSGASTPSPTPTLVLLLYNPHTQGWAQSSTRTPSCSHSRQKKTEHVLGRDVKRPRRSHMPAWHVADGEKPIVRRNAARNQNCTCHSHEQ